MILTIVLTILAIGLMILIDKHNSTNNNINRWIGAPPVAIPEETNNPNDTQQCSDSPHDNIPESQPLNTTIMITPESEGGQCSDRNYATIVNDPIVNNYITQLDNESMSPTSGIVSYGIGITDPSNPNNNHYILEIDLLDDKVNKSRFPKFIHGLKIIVEVTGMIIPI